MSKARRVIIAFVIAEAIAAALPTGVALAQYPGSNGLIGYQTHPDRSSDRVDLYAVRPDGSGAHLLVPPDLTQSSFDYGPTFSSDGARIGYSRCCDDGAMTVNLDGTDMLTAGGDGYDDGVPEFSPDGSHIIWENQSRVFYANADGTDRHVILSGVDDPTLSPAGFVVYVGSNGEVYQVWPDPLGVPQQLTDSGRPHHQPDVSPDGQTLVFTSGTCCQWSLWTADLSVYPAAETKIHDDWAWGVWSPDGTLIAYEDQIAGGIWTATPQGGSPHEVAPAGFGRPGWQPRRPGPLIFHPLLHFQATAIGPASSPTIPAQLGWHAASAVCAFQAQRRLNGPDTPWQAVSLASNTAKTLTQSLLAGDTYEYRVRAQSCAGAWGGWSQGFVPFAVAAAQEWSSAITYSGSWSRVTQSSAWAGALRRTSSGGAAATYTFTGRNVAVVGTRGPAYGSFQVVVDGVLRGTVDAHASATASRRILFRYGWPRAGQHTIRIMNLATAGHPRIDLDGFAVFR